MTKSQCVACYFWNNYIFPHTALSSVNLRSNLMLKRQRAREKERLSRSRQENQRHREIHGAHGRWLQGGTNDTRDQIFPCEQLRSPLCPATAATAFFTKQHIPWEVYPLNKGTRNQVLCPCHFHWKFVYDSGWPYFFFKTNTHFLFWLATHHFQQVNNYIHSW